MAPLLPSQRLRRTAAKGQNCSTDAGDRNDRFGRNRASGSPPSARGPAAGSICCDGGFTYARSKWRITANTENLWKSS